MRIERYKEGATPIHALLHILNDTTFEGDRMRTRFGMMRWGDTEVTCCLNDALVLAAGDNPVVSLLDTLNFTSESNAEKLVHVDAFYMRDHDVMTLVGYKIIHDDKLKVLEEDLDTFVDMMKNNTFRNNVLDSSGNVNGTFMHVRGKVGFNHMYEPNWFGATSISGIKSNALGNTTDTRFQCAIRQFSHNCVNLGSDCTFNNIELQLTARYMEDATWKVIEIALGSNTAGNPMLLQQVLDENMGVMLGLIIPRPVMKRLYVVVFKLGYWELDAGEGQWRIYGAASQHSREFIKPELCKWSRLLGKGSRSTAEKHATRLSMELQTMRIKT